MVEGLPQKVASHWLGSVHVPAARHVLAAVAETVALDRGLDDLPFPCKDSPTLACGLGTKEASPTGGAEWPEGERWAELLGERV